MAANKWAIMGGITLNVDYMRKYGFDATAAAKVTAKLVAVPPPTAFQEAVQVDLASRARLAAPAPDQARVEPTEDTGDEEWEEDTFSAEDSLSRENAFLDDDNDDDDADVDDADDADDDAGDIEDEP